MRRTVTALVLALCAALWIPTAAVALPLGPATPALGPSPVTATLAPGEAVVFSMPLEAAETLSVSVTAPGSPATFDADAYLYAPGSTQTDHAAALRSSRGPATAYPESIVYQAPAAGTYYLEIHAFEGAGTVTVAWSVAAEPLLPVYRFYNTRSGTHFYTPSAEERDTVLARWPGVFSYEGIAYQTRASRNNQPLYRFYNTRNGSHFYTASAEERDTVIARWSATFNYEGETYRVSTVPEPGKVPVYRFYNRVNGGHFYTASAEERDVVMIRWPAVYAYEGAAFYLGQ